MKEGGSISIWFFVGLSLAVNGALILGAGIYELIRPLENPPVLFQLHASIWWGALMLVLGLVYCMHYPPQQGDRRK
jgi:hypothetical protein